MVSGTCARKSLGGDANVVAVDFCDVEVEEEVLVVDDAAVRDGTSSSEASAKMLRTFEVVAGVDDADCFDWKFLKLKGLLNDASSSSGVRLAPTPLIVFANTAVAA